MSRQANRLPISAAFGGSWPERTRFYILLGFIFLCLIGGGASRADVMSLLYLRPAGILCLLALLLSPGRWEFRRFRSLFILLGLFAATMLVQLIPLPPGIWLNLPGHERLAEAAAASGFAEPWRPISLTPDLTLNSLLALLPAIVILVAFAGIREDQRQALLPILICLVFADAVFSVFQFVGGENSPTYLYAITNSDAPVGFFSNRNHHALFLALGFPMLATWLGMPARDSRHRRTRLWVAAAIGLCLIPMILVTGSRAGAVMGGIGLVVAYFLAPAFATRLSPRRQLILRAGAILLPIFLVLVTIFADRAISLARVQTQSLESEVRVEALPVLSQMLRSFLPEGIGYGAFDPAFRIYEPDSILSPTYFNHAHNDLAELLLTGGVPAGALLLLFLWIFLRRGIRSFRRSHSSIGALDHARLGAILIALVLAASIVDYPLRVPLMSVVFAIACAWLTLPKEKLAVDPDAAGRTRAEPRRAGAGRRWTARIAILVGAFGLGWVALGVTTALVLGRLQPDIVLGWWPVDAEARAVAAARALESRTRPAPEVLAEATALAQDALRREPVNVVAARTLGLAAALRGNQAEAERLVSYAESLSRRDLGIQFWLIEASVQKNDIVGALLHYDRALRTSPEAGDALYPVLVEASTHPDVSRPLAALIARRPPWWRDFIVRLLAEGSPVGIEAIVPAIRLNPEDTDQRALLVAALDRVVVAHDPARAFEIYRRVAGPGRSPSALLRNGDFEQENLLPPIDWMVSDREGLTGLMQPRPNGRGRALFLFHDHDAGGEIAHQLLRLPPGSYRLDAVVGATTGTPADRPELTLSCAETNTALLALRFPAVPQAGADAGQAFAVPSDRCAFQWLRLNVPSRMDEDAPTPWIDDIAIRPAQ